MFVFLFFLNPDLVTSDVVGQLVHLFINTPVIMKRESHGLLNFVGYNDNVRFPDSAPVLKASPDESHAGLKDGA